MSKNTILLSVLFALGVAAGAAVMYRFDTDDGPQGVEEPQASSDPAQAASGHPMASAFVISQATDSERILALEEQIVRLEQRIEQLETTVDTGKPADDTAAALSAVMQNQSTADTPVSSVSPAISTGNLVKAGVDPELAQDIVRRSNEIDLKLLELSDRAKREDYFGTARYRRERNALQEKEVSLRQELGDDYYDNYLFVSGQTNRVKVMSVMMGSAAEMSGMRDGDIIVNYDDRKLFSWSELQQATSRGLRGEYVNVSVLRNGELVNLWVPRGPLGIRLGSARVQPQEN